MAMPPVKSSPPPEELPLIRASDFDEKGSLQIDHELYSRQLLETSEFLKLFNRQVKSMKISRRTLQFYSSPQLKLMPLPIYKEGHGHKAHYIYPDHFRRLISVQTLKIKYYFPLWLIRELLNDFNHHEIMMYVDLMNIAPGDLLELLPLTKKVDIGELFPFHACQTLMKYSGWCSLDDSRKTAIDDPAEAFRKEVLASVDGIEDWVNKTGKKTYLQIQLAKHDPEVKTLIDKFKGYKLKLLRQS